MTTNIDNGFVDIDSWGGEKVSGQPLSVADSYNDGIDATTTFIPSMLAVTGGYSLYFNQYFPVTNRAGDMNTTDVQADLDSNTIFGNDQMNFIKAWGNVALTEAKDAFSGFADTDKLAGVNAVIKAYNPTYDEIDILTAYLPSQTYTGDQMELAVGNNQRAWNGIPVAPAQELYTNNVIDISGGFSTPILGAYLYGTQSNDNTKMITPMVESLADGEYKPLQVTLTGYAGGVVSPTNPVDVQTAFKTHNSGFDTTGSGTTQDNTLAPKQTYSMTVFSDNGTATSWTVDLEASFDGSRWTTILTHSKLIDGEAGIEFVTDKLCNYVRFTCTELTLGTANNILATIIEK